MGLHARKFASGIANNIGADQHAHPHSLISAFVILVLESFTSKATSKFSSFYLYSGAVETISSLALLSETLKTGFVALRPNYEINKMIIISVLFSKHASFF